MDYRIGDRVWRAWRDFHGRRGGWHTAYVVALRKRENRVIVRERNGRHEFAVPLWDVRPWTNVGHRHGYPDFL